MIRSGFGGRAEVGPDRNEVVVLLGPAYSIHQVAEKLGTALGKKLNVVDIPPAAHVATLTQAGMSPSMAEALAEMYAALAPGLVAPAGDRFETGRRRSTRSSRARGRIEPGR